MNNPATYPNPWGLPPDVLAPFHRFITCEYATVSAKNQPLTYPVTPYVSPDGKTLDVSTGLTYPAKAERARRNAKVCLLYSYPMGSGLSNPPTVLVYGSAAVRDHNIQANTDRYVRVLQARDFMPPLPPFILRRIVWYFARIWIEVTPLRVLWWNHLDQPAQEWRAPADIVLPTSDAAPASAPPSRWKDAPDNWQERAQYAALKLGTPVVTSIDTQGYPVPLRVKNAALTADGFELELHKAVPAVPSGSACLTFHTHPEKFTGQENMVFLGSVTGSSSLHFRVERCPGDWSLPPQGMGTITSFFGNGMKLAPRVKSESARRGQPVPKVNL